MKNLSHENITKIKNVTHTENKSKGWTAYLDIEDKEFVLHYPDDLRGSAKNVSTDEIIIVYQRIGKNRYYTHLVKPVDNEIYEQKENVGFQYGRLVEVIAFTGIENKIPCREAYVDMRNSFGNNINANQE